MADNKKGQPGRRQQSDKNQNHAAQAGEDEEGVGLVSQLLGNRPDRSNILFDGFAEIFKVFFRLSEQQGPGLVLAAFVGHRPQTLAAFKENFTVVNYFRKKSLSRGGLQATLYILNGLFKFGALLCKQFFDALNLFRICR